jgi:hypothetical protein
LLAAGDGGLDGVEVCLGVGHDGCTCLSVFGAVSDRSR